MSCSFHDYLPLYMDEELPPLEIILLEEHLQTCRDCRRELNQLKILEWDLKKQFNMAEVPSHALAACREKALAEHFPSSAEKKLQNEVKSPAMVVVGLQLTTLKNSLSFCSYLPGSGLLNRSLHRWGKSARVSFRKRNPLISRIIFG